MRNALPYDVVRYAARQLDAGCVRSGKKVLLIEPAHHVGGMTSLASRNDLGNLTLSRDDAGVLFPHLHTIRAKKHGDSKTARAIHGAAQKPAFSEKLQLQWILLSPRWQRGFQIRCFAERMSGTRLERSARSQKRCKTHTARESISIRTESGRFVLLPKSSSIARYEGDPNGQSGVQ